MLKMTKNEFKLQFANLWQMALVVLGMFAAGEIVVAIIMAATSPDDGATLGWLFAMMGLAFWFFCVGAQIVTGLNNAISMSRTRKSYLAAHYLVNFSFSAAMVAFVWLLGQLERLGWRLLYPGLPMEFDFSKWFGLKVAMLIVMVGVVIASFLGALIARFGKKAFWALWAIWMFAFLILPRMADNMEESTTVLGMIGRTVFRFFASVPPAVWKTLGVFGLVGCLIGTVLLLRRQASAY